MAKIPVSIDMITNSSGEREIGITLRLSDLESSGASIRTQIEGFKKDYQDAITQSKKIDSKKTERKVSTRQRWKACKILADFNNKASNKFVITNYKQAYSRDFGIPMRSIRTYIDFGANFEDEEVVDNIPYSIYAELVFRINKLQIAGQFGYEKNRLIEMSKTGSLPNRDEYRAQLKNIKAEY